MSRLASLWSVLEVTFPADPELDERAEQQRDEAWEWIDAEPPHSWLPAEED